MRGILWLAVLGCLSAFGAPPEVGFDDIVRATGVNLTWRSSERCDVRVEASVDAKTWRPVALVGKTGGAVDFVGRYFRFTPACGDLERAELAHTVPTPAELVNVFMGTNNEGPSYSRGNQYPGIHNPFGMAAWSVGTGNLPETWFYDYKETQISGVKLTHQATVWGEDYGQLDLMPMTGTPSADYRARRSPYDREREVAHPYYYRNTLNRYGITFELAPSDRGGIFRFRYPDGARPLIVLHGAEAPTAFVRRAGPHAIEGTINNGGARTHFRAEFDRDIVRLDTAPDRLATIEFAPATTANVVGMKLATSFISVAQAADNLALELEPHTLETLSAESKAKWEAMLGILQVSGGRPADRMTFYSALYRVLAFPKMHWEPVGRDTKRAQYFSPYDDKVHLDRKLWSGNGFWDSYRAVWPLFTVLFPELTGEMLDGWVNSYKDGGWTVRWSRPGYWEIMIGTHSDIIFADALRKGIRNWDYHAAYDSALKNAMVANGYDGKGRRFLERSAFLGYVPWRDGEEADEGAARTMEDSINDFGVSVLAGLLGHRDEQRYFENRARAYTRLWDPATRFFRPKDAAGNFNFPLAQFDPYAWRHGWTEGNSWHYRFPAMHDGNGMAALFGGPAGMERALDELMTADTRFSVGGYGQVIHEMVEAQAAGKLGFGQFAIGNEPAHHFLHMFTYAGRPSKTQYWVRRALRDLFVSGFGDGYGYPGDEDTGQMSAWFVMNALGFYSAAPGLGQYVLASPLFPRVTIHPPGGKPFTIRASGDDDDHVYIASARLNGKAYDRPYLEHAAIAAGGSLEFTMSRTPTAWGENARPASLSSGMPVYLTALTEGAKVSASGANPPGETPDKLVDRNSDTKWLVRSPQGTFSLELTKSSPADCYTLTSAGDAPARDPRTWRLQASDDGRTWRVVDERRDVAFANRRETKLFCFAAPVSAARYRMEILANSGAPELQIAEFELRALPPAR